MKIAVTGAQGLLGREFVRVAGTRHDVVGWSRAELDVTDADACMQRVLAVHPDWVVHCAAYTAVDRAEDEPELAMRVNRDGARNVAQAAQEAACPVAYVSTDYVFDGARTVPYAPDHPVGPQSSYGRSKQAGEDAVLAVNPSTALILRTGWLYGEHGRDFVDAMLGLAGPGGDSGGSSVVRVVEDQVGRPSWARNVAINSLALIERNASGVYHVADGDQASWLEFAREIFGIIGAQVEVVGVTTEEWGAAAPRPRYSVLNLDRTEVELGYPMQSWRRALAAYLETVDRGGAR